MKKTKLSQAVLLSLAVLIVLASPVLAHKVNIFAYVEHQTIYTESYFPDGRPVAEGRILVLDGDKNQILEGRTGKEGLFQFPVPKMDDLTIVVDAGLGHKSSFRLKKSTLKEE